MDEAPSFGRWLHQRRRTLDLTQAELARRVGYSEVTIRKIEADELRPSKQIAERLAECLDLPVADRPAFVRFARDRRQGQSEIASLPGPSLPAPSTSTSIPSRHDLPASPTALVGRQEEVEAVRDWLLRGDIRLVTLMGPGGTGKTRLALHVAHALTANDKRLTTDGGLVSPGGQQSAVSGPSFSDGVYFVNLAPLTDPRLVASAIAQALDVREEATRPVLSTLKDYLREKETLLLLDNFEHVVAGASAVAELLAAAPRLKVLATSRVPLRLRGEQEFNVPPLALPDPARLPPIETLAQYSALELFRQRAVNVRRDFAVTVDNVGAVVEICRRLDGLPLAIELAAARLRWLSPQALLQRLDRRLPLLSDGPRDLPSRQQTMRNAIAWSYNLLSQREKMLFRRLGVFVGGFTLDAAEAVCLVAADLEGIFDGIAALGDSSLVRSAKGLDGEPRFTLLETIREYVGERLDESGELRAVQERHALWCLRMAEAAEVGVITADVERWMPRLEAEHDNLRAALGWCLVEANDVELGLRLAAALVPFWRYRAYSREGLRWLEIGLKVSETEGPTWVRVKALRGAGVLARQLDDHAVARVRLEESVALARELGDRPSLAAALNQLGWLELHQRRVRTARSVFEESVALWREQDDPAQIALALYGLGAAVEREDPAAARPILEESVALCRRHGFKLFLTNGLTVLGDVMCLQGDYEYAKRLYDEGLLLSQAMGNTGMAASALLALGTVAICTGDYAQATVHLRASLELGLELKIRSHIALVLAGCGGLLTATGRPVRGVQLLSAAETLLHALGMSISVWPLDDREYRRHLAAAHSQLDTATFAAVWAEGRAMTMEQAVAYALGDRET